MTPTAVKHCPTCSGALERDGICLACFFTEALSAVDVASSSAGQTEAGRAYASLGRMQLPCKFAGHLLLTREIAAGGMGIVYEAEDQRLKRAVALKVIRSAAFARPEDLARFQAEAEAAAHLDHPNIVPIYEMGDVDGVPFFTMRLMDGPSLAARLVAAGQPLPAREAAALMSKVARAVQHAHERGVLHRDLKPANILLDGNGEPHLTDFGLAKLLDADSSLTRSQAHLGTPHYMSPEQAAGRTREITTASDVWALGIILYQLLTTHLPFNGESSAEVMRRIVEDQPVRPDVSSCDSDLATLIARCLEKDPSRRLHSAGFLADELDRYLRGEPIVSRPIGSGERAWKWMRQHRTATIAALVTTLAILGGASVAAWQAVQATRARDAARHQLRDAEEGARLIMETMLALNPEDAGPVVSQTKLKRTLMSEIEAFAGDPLRKMQMFVTMGDHLHSEEAVEAYQKAADVASHALDSDDPRLWAVRRKLVAAKAVRSSDDGGRKLIPELRQIYEWQRQHLGPRHDDTMKSLLSLARRLGFAGEYEESVKLFDEVESYLAEKPKTGISIIQFRSDYGTMLYGAGRREDGLAMSRKLCAELTDPKAKTLFIGARALADHARLCKKEGLADEALTTARLALDQFWKTSGPTDTYAGYCLDFVLDYQRQRNDIEGMFATYREAIHMFDMKVGPGRTATLDVVSKYANALTKAKRSQEADALCQQWLDRVRSLTGQLPTSSEYLLLAYTKALRALSDLPRAETALRELIAMEEKVRPRDWETFPDMTSLAEVILKQGRRDEARKLLEDVVAGLEKHQAEDKDIEAKHLPQARTLLEQAHTTPP